MYIAFYKEYNIRDAPYLKACTCIDAHELCDLCHSTRTTERLPDCDIPDWIANRVHYEESDAESINRAEDSHGARFTETNHLGQASLRRVYGSNYRFDLRQNESIFIQFSGKCSRWQRAIVNRRLSETPTPTILIELDSKDHAILVAHREDGEHLGSQLEFFLVECSSEYYTIMHGYSDLSNNVGQCVRIQYGNEASIDESPICVEYSIIGLHQLNKSGNIVADDGCENEGSHIILELTSRSVLGTHLCVLIYRHDRNNPRRCWTLPNRDVDEDIQKGIETQDREFQPTMVLVRRMACYLVDVDGTSEVNTELRGANDSIALGAFATS